MTIVVLYILLVLSVVAVLWVAMAVFRRVRKGMSDKDKPTDTGLFPPRGNDDEQKQE
jgi:hypothetical protein